MKFISIISIFAAIIWAISSTSNENSHKKLITENNVVIDSTKTETADSKHALGLISKKHLTKNIEKNATVWEEKHRVKGGIVTITTIVQEDFQGDFSTMIKVKHKNLKGKQIYSRTAYSRSKSITIYRFGKDGFSNAQTGVTELIDFKSTPSKECLKNHYTLLEVAEVCKASVKILSNGNTLLLRINPRGAALFNSLGKRIKTIKASAPDFLNVVDAHIKQIYKDRKIVKPLKEPLI